VDKVSDGIDKRQVYTAILPQGLSNYKVIGTIEAGFSNPDASITRKMAIKLVNLISMRSSQLHFASLDHVFETIVQTAHKTVGADDAWLGFWYNNDRNCFEYEVAAGNQGLLDWHRTGQLARI
jgi:hypothetical protein